MADLVEVFEYRFTRLDPVRGDHIDPPSVAIYETLLTKGPDGRPRPGLASAWSVSDDGLTWRLRLREDARFHSGRACDAATVVEALELCRWGEGLSRQVWYWDPVDALTAADEQTVVIRLHHPCPRLPVLLWGTHTAVVNPQTWHRLGSAFGVEAADGTGPYRLTSFSPDEVVAERTVPSAQRPGSIRWRSVPEEAERDSVLASSAADVIRQPGVCPSADLGWTVHQQQENSQFYLALNFADPRGFADSRLRRSIDAFIDRDEILAVALDGEGDARRSPIPAGDEFASAYSPEDVPALTRAEARAMLRSLGWVAGADGILVRDGLAMRIDVVAQDTGVCRRVAAVLRTQLRAAGVDLRFTFHELFEPFYRAVEAQPAAFLNKWLWPDAMEAVYGFSRTDCIEPAGGNWQASACPTVDQAFDRFREAAEPAALRMASADLQRVFMQELPYLPLVSPVERLAVRTGVSGFGLMPRTLYPSYDEVTVSR